MTDLRKLTNATLRDMIEKAGIELEDAESLTKKELISIYEAYEHAAATPAPAQETPSVDTVFCAGCRRELPDDDWFLVLPKNAPPALTQSAEVIRDRSFCSGCAHMELRRDTSLEIVPVEVE